METATKLVTIVGAIFAIRGMFAVLTGAMDFFNGRKNENPAKVDSGVESMISGGAMAAISASVSAIIINAMNNIKF